MPGGKGNIRPEDGTPFSKENQPKNKRGVSLVSKLKSMLSDDPERVTKILESVIKKAEKGDLKAVEIVLDRVDGKPTQTIEQNNKHTLTEGFDLKKLYDKEA